MCRYALTLVLLLLSAGAWADDFLGTRPLGMGNAYRAVATGNDAIFLNPAGMALFKSYSIEAEYLITPNFGSKDGPVEHVIQGSVVDNSSSQYFATGAAYTRVQRGDQKTGNRFDLAFAVPVINNLLIGIDAKYLDFDKFGKKNALNAITFDVGALVRTSFGLSLAAVGYNLTNTADYVEHPISMGAAAMYSPFRTLEVAFDWLANFQKPKDADQPKNNHSTGYSYNVGIEYLLLDQLVLRGGYSYDQTSPYGDRHFVAAGIGYISSQVTLDLGYRGTPSQGYGYVLGVTLRFFLQEQQLNVKNR